MHPQYVSDKPGAAPCCGMRLEPVYADGHDEHEEHEHAGRSRRAGGISLDKQQLIGIRTAVVERSTVHHVIRVPGRVAPDEVRTYVVNASADGWIREVYPVTTGSQVARHQPLAAFYSKELMPAQQNYFYGMNNLDRLVKSNAQSQDQLNVTRVQVWSYEDILEELGMDEIQRAEIAQSRKFARKVILRAPGPGFVLSRNVAPGQRFERGQELFRIADLHHIWILADLYENEAGHLRAGMPAEVSYHGRAFEAHVSDVLPQFDASTRTLKVRLELENPSFLLRPDMFVDVEIPIELPESTRIPIDAVIDSGLSKTVYVDLGSGVFEPRTVETGAAAGDSVEVVRGLEPGERIVVSGNFLLDSETRMKQALDGVKAAARDLVCGMEVDTVRAKAAGRTAEYQGKTYHFCADQCKRKFEAGPAAYVDKHKPADAAPSVAVDPVCGMDVDTASSTLKSTHEGRTYYFCAPSCKRSFDADPKRYLKTRGTKRDGHDGDGH